MVGQICSDLTEDVLKRNHFTRDALTRSVSAFEAPHPLCTTYLYTASAHSPSWTIVDKMSSLMDQVLASDNLTSDNADQDARSVASSQTAGRQPRARAAPSVGTPGASTPGVSTPGMHSDAIGFEDDELVGAAGRRRQNKQEERGGPVLDATAEKIFNSFHRFLET